MFGKTNVRGTGEPHPAQHPASAHLASQGGTWKAQIPCRSTRRASDGEPAQQAGTQRAQVVYPTEGRQWGDASAFLDTPAGGQTSSSAQKTMLAQG